MIAFPRLRAGKPRARLRAAFSFDVATICRGDSLAVFAAERTVIILNSDLFNDPSMSSRLCELKLAASSESALVSSS